MAGIHDQTNVIHTQSDCGIGVIENNIITGLITPDSGRHAFQLPLRDGDTATVDLGILAPDMEISSRDEFNPNTDPHLLLRAGKQTLDCGASPDIPAFTEQSERDWYALIPNFPYEFTVEPWGDGELWFGFLFKNFTQDGYWCLSWEYGEDGSPTSAYGAISDLTLAVPEPAFSTIPKYPSTGEEVTLDASGTESNLPLDFGDPIAEYEWDIRDNSTSEKLYGERIEYVFDSGGVYDITLTVMNASGNIESKIKSIAVRGLPYFEIEITGAMLSAEANEIVIDTQITNTGQTVGEQTVSLRVTDLGEDTSIVEVEPGDTAEPQFFIDVDNPQPGEYTAVGATDQTTATRQFSIPQRTDSTPTQTEPSQQPQDSPANTEQSQADDSGIGFSHLSAVGGITGVSYLLRKRLTDS